MTTSKAGPKGPSARGRGRPRKEVPAWALFGLWRLVRQELRGPRDVAAACERLAERFKGGIQLPAFDEAGQPVTVARIFATDKRAKPLGVAEARRYSGELLRKHYRRAERKRQGSDATAVELNRLCVEWEARQAIAWGARAEAAARSEAAEASLQASEREGLFQTHQFDEMSRRANEAAEGVELKPTAPPVPQKNRR